MKMGLIEKIKKKKEVNDEIACGVRVCCLGEERERQKEREKQRREQVDSVVTDLRFTRRFYVNASFVGDLIIGPFSY